jgi:hypothetical protein
LVGYLFDFVLNVFSHDDLPQRVRRAGVGASRDPARTAMICTKSANDVPANESLSHWPFHYVAPQR